MPWTNYMRRIRIDVKDEVPDGSHWTFVTSSGWNVADQIVAVASTAHGVHVFNQHAFLHVFYMLLGNRQFVMSWPPTNPTDFIQSNGFHWGEQPVWASAIRKLTDDFVESTRGSGRIVLKEVWSLMNFRELDSVFPGCLKVNVTAGPLFRSATMISGRRKVGGAIDDDYFDLMMTEIRGGRGHDREAGWMGLPKIRTDLLSSRSEIADAVRSSIIPGVDGPSQLTPIMDSAERVIGELREVSESDPDVERFIEHVGKHDRELQEWICRGSDD